MLGCRATPHRGAAFPFSYMEPGKNKEVIQPYVTDGFPIDRMAPIGLHACLIHSCLLPRQHQDISNGACNIRQSADGARSNMSYMKASHDCLDKKCKI